MRMVDPLSDFDQFKIVLASSTFRAHPVYWYVVPARARGNAFIRQAGGLVVNEPADQAHVSFANGSFGSSHCRDSFRIESHFKAIGRVRIAVADTPPMVLVFAATDPSGGAGWHADILTLSSMGCHPLCVVTALTIQDTFGVEDKLPIDADWVADQARCVLEDAQVSVFKAGLLGSVEAIAAVAEVVSDYPQVPFVLDPVLASGGGDELASDEMVAAMCELLIPQATVLTPNSHEARHLAFDDGDDTDMPGLDECAARLLDMGAEYVLITGTHENTAQVTNSLYASSGLVRADSWQRLPGSFHGSGCTLAAAVAATIANGLDVPEAVRDAQEYTWQTLKSAYRTGMGQLIPDRLFWARDKDSNEEDSNDEDSNE
jgi:hydroxymethylpyrimidine/phosphomethylpyrimidine kinase